MLRNASPLVLAALLAAPALASGGAWVMTERLPATTSGLYVQAGDVAAPPGGDAPAALVLEGWGDRVLYLPDPLNSSAWVQAPVTVVPTGEASLRLHAGALDAAGQPVALVTVGGVDGLFVRSAAGWAFRPLGPGLGVPHLAASPTGALHACLVTQEGVVHAWGSAAGAWSSEVAWPAPLETGECAIAAPSDADVRIVFDGAFGKLHHARRGPGGFAVTLVPLAINATAQVRVAVDAAGASYVAVQPGVGARLLTDETGAWTEEAPPGLLAQNSRPTLAAGPVKPHVGTTSAAVRIWSWQ